MMGVLNHLSTLLLLSLLPPALSHVVKKFSDVPQCTEFFMGGTTPNIPGILVNGTVQNQGQNQNRYKPICQLFNNIYRFATLYDTTNRIPVFSAYTFTGNTNQHSSTVEKFKRPKWMIEPQLEDINNQRDMKVDNEAVTHNFQAANADYINNSLRLTRGHLFPCSYAPDDAAKNSTFTLTNAVPQESSFNGGSWEKMECRVREALVNNCKNNNKKIKAYVVTGAVPNINNNQLKERVNIPDLLWTAFCCYNSEKDKWMAGAHWGKNKKELKNTKVLEPHNLTDLYAMLNIYYHGDGVVGGDGDYYYGDGVVKVFPDQCSNGDIPTELLVSCVCPQKRKFDAGDDGGDVQTKKKKKKKNVDTPIALLLKDGGDEHDHCEYDDDCVCSSVGVKGYYLPVVFVSVLVMMM